MRKKISMGIIFVLVVNMLLGAIVSAADPVAGGSPIVITMSPADGAKGVPIETNQIQLKFDRDVKMGTGTIEVTKVDNTGETTVVTQPITPQPYVMSRYDISLPTGVLTNGTMYYVKGTAGTFVDANATSIQSDNLRMTFKTISAQGSTAPVISNVAPGRGEIITDEAKELKITFDKTINKGIGFIYVNRASDNQNFIKLSPQDAKIEGDMDNEVSWPISGLSRGERYYVLIDRGAFKDLDDHPFEGISSAQEWYFNVKGNPVTWATSTPTLPANGATGISNTGTVQLNFSRPVYPDSGNLSLRLTDSSGTSVKEFNVTSSEVKGGGTNKITITLPTLSYNQRYSLSALAGVFKDSDNNPSPKVDLSFSTGTTTSTALTWNSLSPLDRSLNNAITTNVVATFNRDISLTDPSGATGIKLMKQGTTTPITARVSTSGKQLIIIPSANLQEGTTYYVDIASGAIKDQSTGELFRGLDGASSWTFQTLVSDKTAPVIQSSTMYSNSVIRLQYNKTLDSTINLLTSSFAVTVNGETRRISSAYVSGESVYVTLDTGVAVGQVIRISYSGNSVRPVQDLSKNPAASFSNREVTNGVDSVLPKPVEGSVSGSTLTLTFSESLKSLSSRYAYDQFSVTADGYSKGINSIYQSGRTITLYLSSSVSNGEIVKVSYSPGSYPLQDSRGQNISAFSDYFVRNTYDTKPPELTEIEGSGNKITLTYNEALKTTNIPMKSQFSVLVNNTAVYVTNIEVVSNRVVLTLASSFTKDQVVTLSYVSGYGGIADLNGNLAGYIDLQPITYSLLMEGIRYATVKGDIITVVYNNTLKPTSFLPVNQFDVSVDKVNRGVQTATVSGDTVTLKLSSAVTANQVVSLSYMTGSTPLYDNQGTILKAYTNMPVQNVTDKGTTTSTPGGIEQPNYVTQMSASDFGKSGYLLNISVAQALQSLSRNGESIKKYSLDSTKVLAGMKYVTNNNVSKMLVFEVPSTEKAAQVDIPLSALLEVYSSGKTGSFAVKYKDYMYELPIDKIPYTEISRVLGSSTMSAANLTVQLEAISRAQLAVTTSNNAVTTTPLVDPVQLYVTANNGPNMDAGEVSHIGQLYFRVSGSLPSTNQVALFKYNVATSKLSFMPSSVIGSSASMIFSGKVNGNSIIGPAVGYSFFSDTTKHWAKEAISELAGKLIVEPRSGSYDKFEPDKNITRAEFAVFIAKGLGLSGDMSRRFPDVSTGAVGEYIGAAAKAGIITGYTDGTFKPNSYITREQMALMMVRAMEYTGYSVSNNGTTTQTLSKFKDASKIQSKETVAKAVREGIIQGMTSNTFQPQGNATRAQAVVMLKRVLDKLD
ncbi:Ig-like domain-containing protein [Paenibacillus segetis]|uniref:SLH domain-containing protein n=1 Tax=Paenibacillus segetis TaxID=1325360 RepID=A0ABQ1YQ62_9BACL|nr:SwmB domain-containing protein [Paenibacillus segetis]GGH32917.1 hypothetical protein GCM10008013_37630 [Paenibacillus segetis]